MNYRKILADNVLALMDRTPEMNSHAKLAKHCSTATRKIGARTIGHLLNWEGGVQPKLDTIIAIAEAFKIVPWQLLRSDFDPESRTNEELPAPEIIELARRIAALNPQRRELLMDIFMEAVPDHELEAAGFAAPAGKQLAVHQSPAPYNKPPRQMRIKLKHK